MINCPVISQQCRSDHSDLAVGIGTEAQLLLAIVGTVAIADIGSDRVTHIHHLTPEQSQVLAMTKEVVGPKRCFAYGSSEIGGLSDAAANIDGPVSTGITQVDRSRP